ncbi:hypothetical protein BRO54_3454 [Geobacillus proteiniphilus]|uniref:Uncharacterized protein n=1 Tax=Geobacillus proteiniphilus TaxID=860353 RepID=A0A1Q5SLU6_9BACL|nr:hypothetical protein BRO54_3454 [Geobacillus proteiniphilus]
MTPGVGCPASLFRRQTAMGRLPSFWGRIHNRVDVAALLGAARR